MSECRVCRAETDAFLCVSCTNEIEYAIADLPILTRAVLGVATRQSRVFRPADPSQVDAEWLDPEAQLPAMLRSRDGRIALRATTAPGDLEAAALVQTANNTITTWARHILEARNLAIPLGPACVRCMHQNCVLIRAADDPHSLLLTYAESIRFDHAAAEAHAHITDLHAVMERMVDSLPPSIYAGKCDAPDVKVDALLLAGAPCSTLICAHETCEQIRQGVAMLSPRAATCGVDLYFEEGQKAIQCEACGAVYDVVKRHGEMAAKADDRWERPHVIARALTSLQHPIKPDTLRKWIERDRKAADQGRIVDRTLILQVGIDDDGNALYRVGDVRTRIAEVRAERVAC